MGKGISVQEMSGIALAFGILAIILGIGATILTQVQSGQTSGTAAYTATGYGITGLSTIGAWLPTIAVIAAAAIVIGIIITYFRSG